MRKLSYSLKEKYISIIPMRVQGAVHGQLSPFLNTTTVYLHLCTDFRTICDVLLNQIYFERIIRVT
jgi:hypothetical protein